MLILICGRSGAGKTTFARKWPDAICLDRMGKIAERYAAVNTRVSREMGDVCVEGLYNKPEHRRALIAAYKGKKKLCFFIDTPQETIEKRCRENNRPWIIHPFVPPTMDEGWDEIIIKRN